MKIYKIAQGVPQGFVKLRIIVKKNADVDYEGRFIRGGASQCSEGSGDALEQILNMPLEGFGHEFATGDLKKTEEYYEQTRPQVPTPLPASPQEEDVVTRRPEKRLDQGYGT